VSRRLPANLRHNTWVIFALKDGTVVCSLEDEGGVDEILKRLVVTIGGRKFFRIIYPRVKGSPGVQSMAPAVDWAGTPAQQALIAVDQVDHAWTQAEPPRPRLSPAGSASTPG
jgi:hypothetical protein